MVRASVATSPVDMVFEFMFHATHVEVPGLLLQVIVAVPRLEVTLNAATSVVEYVTVHSRDAGAVTVDATDKPKLTMLPGVPDPGERARATLCARPAVRSSAPMTQTWTALPGTCVLITVVKCSYHFAHLCAATSSLKY